ncbi:MAG: 1-(5-phosphoribosyl)-5-((5-phosphoribosylamino)methylideneamino)imidazole-4-carboxamide isomerase, partial [Nitrospirae bacterium]|nr:1-(5-phosphoribosyl)-5-((5-phosphoribosylamino)methylideneamino)imidazole-4-carboxamide isomerase [Nitrospirota bacterium]
ALHLVDLDGAVTGTPQNLPAIKEILLEADIPVQVGGGVRNLPVMKRLFELGAARVVVGTGAVRDREFLRSACGEYPGRVVVSVDAKDGFVALSGWVEMSRTPVRELLDEIVGLPLAGILYTDIRRDGMLGGPNVEAVKAVASASRHPVIAAGGVGSLDDIRRLKAVDPPLAGVIVGKALYTGAVDLNEALSILDGGPR